MSEELLNLSVYNYLSGLNQIVLSEVPFMSRKIDIVLYQKDTIVTYELKLRNWKKAIEQMLDHSIASHYCYLCMPAKGKSKELIERICDNLNQYGFGLMLWDESVGEPKEILSARESEYRNKVATSYLIGNIKTIQKCQK